MKIAMLIDGWQPVFGWWQVHVQELCKWLVRNHNCEVDLFVRKLKDDKWKKWTENEVLENWKWKIYRTWPTTKFFNIFWRILALINTTIQLYFKAKKEKYDIIHAHAYVSWLPAKIVGKLLKIPVVYTVHWVNQLDTDKWWFLKKIEKWLVSWIKYDCEISVWKEFLKYPNVNKNIKVIPNGVDIEKFDKIRVGCQDDYQKIKADDIWKFQDDNIVNLKWNDCEKYDWFNFLWVGRFSWEKWDDYLIKWLSLVDKKLLKEKWFKLNLVGDGEDRKKIKKLVKQLNLEEFVNFKWKLFQDELIKEYKKNHIFILPSLSEWQPLTVLEAFASKIPVIATDVGDNKYFINKNNWFLIKSQDENEIKKIIENVLKFDKEKLSLLWENGYNLVKENYT